MPADLRVRVRVGVGWVAVALVALLLVLAGCARSVTEPYPSWAVRDAWATCQARLADPGVRDGADSAAVLASATGGRVCADVLAAWAP